MGGEFGGEWIHVYVWLSPITIHLKQSQHCLLIMIPQYKAKSLKKYFYFKKKTKDVSAMTLRKGKKKKKNKQDFSNIGE